MVLAITPWGPTRDIVLAQREMEKRRSPLV
jgi:hypothetical protein